MSMVTILRFAGISSLLGLASACGGGNAGTISAFTAPATQAGANDWLDYVSPPTLDGDSAGGVFPGGASPEAAVVHFYASRIRGDERYREVLNPQPSGRLERGLAEYEKWTFTRFRLVGKKERSPDSAWIKVWFEITIDGSTDDGTDEVGVIQRNGRWWIDSVPT